MARTKFDRQVDETAESVAFGIGRFLAGRPLRGERTTDATFWRSGTRVLPKVEGKVSRSAYRAGWQRLTFRISGLAATGAGGYWALWENQDATVATVRDVWENPDPAIAAAQTGGIGLVSAAAVGSAAYGLATRKRREFMREWVTPLHEALAVPLGMSELTDPRRYLHVPRNFSDDDAEIRIDVPTHMRFNEDLVADLIVKKLALENVSFTWRRAGKDTHVIVKKRQAPPKMLRLSDPGVREILAKMPKSAPLIGFGAGTLNAWRMLVPEVSPIPMPSDHNGRVQVVTRGRAQETQVLNLSNEEARAWAMSGVHAKGTTGFSLHEPPVPAAPADDFADAWSTSASELPPAPATEPPAADRDPVAEVPGLPSSPAAVAPAADVPDTAAASSPTPPAPADDDQALGLREAYDNHLSETVASLDALRRARHDDPEFPAPVGKRGAAFLYRVGDLKKWARNRPRAGTTDID
ncbi:hypothetical protein [Streptomyces thermolilacinus]|uniref:hypothetical protein n=1 Tax=Streptomyces thermolilacinus TaxID=285540 RepID=UPI0033F0A2F3